MVFNPNIIYLWLLRENCSHYIVRAVSFNVEENSNIWKNLDEYRDNSSF